MITPRATRLVRAESLPALHRAVLSLATRGSLADVRRRMIVVPSRAAAHQLRRTLEDLWFGLAPAPQDAAIVLPDLLTRADWYDRMHERAGVAAPMLSAPEREVLLGAAAREAIASGARPPFQLRPGLIAEMLAFYDALRGQQRTIDTFERIVVSDLEPRTEIDRGAERLLRQTRFLVAAFRAFEQRVAASGRLDEHLLRQVLLDPSAPVSTPPRQLRPDCASSDSSASVPASPRERRPPGASSDPCALVLTSPCTHIVITVGDRTAEPAGGLFPADVDLVMRLANVETVHVVATRAQLAAGLGERLHDLIPGLEETDADHLEPAPRLLAPVADEEALHFVSRDREEELRSIARWIKVEARSAAEPVALDRTAVVFKRPLPYVYLARTVFEAAGIEHQAADALPLASEPMAAVLDLVVACAESRFARKAVVALLRSPHLSLAPGGGPLEPADVDAFDRRLAESGYLAHPDALARLAETWDGAGHASAKAAAILAQTLRPLGGQQPVSAHASLLLSFLEQSDRIDAPDEAVRSRHLRARAAVRGALDQLRRASIEFDDPPTSIADVAATVRRWIESQTFSPRCGDGGVQLVDAQAARYGSFDDACLAGLAEGDWPEPSGRNIFYPSFLLSQLGWPSEPARMAAARAAFVDLLRLPRHRVRVSTFTLEDDSIVNPSPLLEELPRCGLPVERPDGPRTPVFVDEALSTEPPAVEAARDDARDWLRLRLLRSPAVDARFHGAAGPGRRRVHTVSAIDQFLQCPFKYFAGKVLGLPEDAVDEPLRAPRAQGQFVHEVFCDFFRAWQASGGGAITADVLDEARARFAEVAEDKLASQPASDAALQRLRLLGSVGTPGLGELVLAAEASRAVPVRERLLEYAFDGEFLIGAAGESRRVRLRGQADRIDLLTDGRFRLIDYKNGKLPELAQTIQLPIYAVCVQQHLERTRGERWEVAEASYLAFGERRPERIVIGDGTDPSKKLADGQERLLDAIDRIERGEFPPRPASPRNCGTCAYATVCRKDFVDAD